MGIEDDMKEVRIRVGRYIIENAIEKKLPITEPDYRKKTMEDLKPIYELLHGSINNFGRNEVTKHLMNMNEYKRNSGGFRTIVDAIIYEIGKESGTKPF